ncbi:hypothetical protein HYW74_00815 [Candidatus Pacearchaeota archaeon]|nr:hypothetical protein [Candidatus Pacearchaeota archaeon]
METTQKSREVKLVVVDDSRTLISSLEANKSVFESQFPFNLSLKTIQLNPNGTFEEAEKRVRAESGDVYIIDYRFGKATDREKSRYNGLDLAKILKHDNPKSSIFLTSVYFDDSMKESSCLSGIYRGVVEAMKDGIIQYVFPKEKIQEFIKSDIKEYVFKPLNLGICGIGTFGTELVNLFLETGAIERVKIYSEHAPIENVPRLLEGKGGNELGLEKSLEDLCQNIDALIFTSSTLRRKEIKDLVKNGNLDRRELFPWEIDKYEKYFLKLKEIDYNGPIIIFANPIPYLSEFGRQLGISSSQLFSPFEPDTFRIRNKLEEICGACKDYKTCNPEKEIREILDNLNPRVIGVHGQPLLALPSLESCSSDFDPETCERLKYLISTAENAAAVLGDESLEASENLDLPYFVPPETVIPFFLDLAHFRQPAVNVHTYVDFSYKNKTYHGFAAVPVEISYKPQISVQPDYNKIRELGEDKVQEYLAPILKIQQSYIKDHLKEKSREEWRDKVSTLVKLRESKTYEEMRLKIILGDLKAALKDTGVI